MVRGYLNLRITYCIFLFTQYLTPQLSTCLIAIKIYFKHYKKLQKSYIANLKTKAI